MSTSTRLLRGAAAARLFKGLCIHSPLSGKRSDAFRHDPCLIRPRGQGGIDDYKSRWAVRKVEHCAVEFLAANKFQRSFGSFPPDLTRRLEHESGQATLWVAGHNILARSTRKHGRVSGRSSMM